MTGLYYSPTESVVQNEMSDVAATGEPSSTNYGKNNI